MRCSARRRRRMEHDRAIQDIYELDVVLAGRIAEAVRLSVSESQTTERLKEATKESRGAIERATTPVLPWHKNAWVSAGVSVLIIAGVAMIACLITPKDPLALGVLALIVLSIKTVSVILRSASEISARPDEKDVVGKIGAFLGAVSEFVGFPAALGAAWAVVLPFLSSL